MELQYKPVNYEDFTNKFNGWDLLENIHYHDKMDKKFYNEYKMRSPKGSNIILLICNYYSKKRVSFNIIVNDNMFAGWDSYHTKVGSKKIKNICDKNIVELSFDKDDLTDEDIYNVKDKCFTEKVLREMIDFFYN